MTSAKRDELDTRILDILRRDAKTPNVKIAKTLGVSEGLIRQRIKKLQDNGIIQRFTIETASAGLKAMVEISVGVNVHTTDIARTVSQMGGVRRVYEVAGSHDIVAVIELDDTTRLNELIENVRRLDDVSSTHTKLILKEL